MSVAQYKSASNIWADAMASEVSMAGAQQDLRRRVADLERELGEAHQREAAAAQLLQVINGSRFELESVFKAIAQSAVQLCEGEFAFVLRFDGELLHYAASRGLSPDGLAAFQRQLPRPADTDTATGRAILQRTVVQIPDVHVDQAYGVKGLAQTVTYRSLVAVPLLRGGNPIGGITVGRAHAGPFPDAQISLLRTFANQAVIAIENMRLFEAEQARTQELGEALEQQRASAEILSVISSSASDAAPVFNKILESCQHLFGGDEMMVNLVDPHGMLQVAAIISKVPDAVAATFPAPVDVTPAGRAIRERRVVHYPDVVNGVDTTPALRRVGLIAGYRSVAFAPMLWQGRGIGVVGVARSRGAFSDKELAVLQGFADQAVIAIENTRLFEAEQASKRELQESFEYQTATSEVLGVISRSPSELQPVLDAITGTARQLGEATRASILEFKDGQFLLVAHRGSEVAGGQRTLAAKVPLGIDRGNLPGRVAIEQRTVHVHDIRSDPEYTYFADRESDQRRTMLCAPLMREGELIGVFVLSRDVVRPFSERQIKLVETFADQAVIAIENTRLFEEVQARNRELTEALEQQTATSDILRAIASSPTDLTAVLDAVAKNAARLCDAEDIGVLQVDGDVLRVGSRYGAGPKQDIGSIARIRRDLILGRAFLDRSTIHVRDMAAALDGEYPGMRGTVERFGMRTMLATPLMSGGEAIGVIVAARYEVRPFTNQQIDLVKAFADQAVIAIENTRLFEAEQTSKRQLQQSLEYQTATNDILNVISRSQSKLQPVLDAIVNTATRLCQADYAFIWKLEGSLFQLAAMNGIDADFAAFARANLPALDRSTSAGRCVLEKRPIHIPDVFADPEYRWQGDEGQRIGNYRTLLGVPLMREDVPFGAFALLRREARPFTDKEVELVASFADQAVIAIENTRLFEEVQARTRELAKTVDDLEIASQHKSQFVANMSHELRTPLAAILGYAELMQEGFYEPQGPKSLDALTRIRSNGKHLLGLINTVLDIAKIESGQFTLNMTEYAIESVVETVRAATESLAQNKKLTLTTSVEKSLPVGLGDEQRLTQVLLNLVGNAIKFADAGEVSIAAGARNGNFAVSVTDTGPGIPLDQQGRIFDQFHQVDSSLTKAKGGTGLGLAIAKQIVEMHGGRIWVESTPGKGSTFQMELPTRAEFHKLAQGGAA
jgi:GAF domain-containing protein